MKKILRQIQDRCRRLPLKKVRQYKNAKIFLGATLVLAAVLLIPHTAMAAAATTQSPTMDQMMKEIVDVTNIILEILHRIMWPVLLLIGGLLNNNILFGAGMEQRVLTIWVEIRNLVNVLFVLVLLGMALYNVVGGTNQSMQLKQALPKFVIALIAVNFSYLAVKLVIDSVNVVSTAIFALPVTINTETGPAKDPKFVNNFCEGIYSSTGGSEAGHIEAKRRALQEGDKSMCTPDGDTDWKFSSESVKAFFTKFDAGNAAMIMALDLQQIDKLSVLKVEEANLKNLMLNIIFSVIMYIIYSTAFVVLFVVLLVRVVTLWVLMVLSPLMVLTYALPDQIKSKVGGDLSSKFIQSAIVPIPIALVMSIGFILHKGLIQSNYTDVITNLPTGSTGLLTSGLDTFQQLIGAVATAAIIWVGIFKAADGTWADGAVKKIQSTVEGVGKFAASSVMYAPMFPVYGAQGKDGTPLKASLAGAMQFTQNLGENRRQGAQQEAQAMANATGIGQAGKAGAEIGSATKLAEAQQGMANAKGLGTQTEASTQRGIAKYYKDHPRELILPPNMKDKDGEKITNVTDLLAKLANGEVHKDTMIDLVNKNVGKAQYKPEAGAPAAGPSQEVVDHVTAPAAIERSAGYKGALDKGEQAAVDAYGNAMSTPGRAKADKALGDKKLTSAVGKLKKLEDDGVAFAASAEDADADKLKVLVTARRGALNKAGIKDPKAQDAVIRKELDKLFTSTTETDKAKISGSGLEGIRGVELPKEVKVETTALEQPAPAAAPAPTTAAPAPAARPAASPAAPKPAAQPAAAPTPASLPKRGAQPTSVAPGTLTGKIEDGWKWTGTEWVKAPGFQD